MLNLVSGRRTLGGADGDDERQNGRNSFFLFPGGGWREQLGCIQMDQHVNDPLRKEKRKRKEGGK
jgi:hypothetical protein